MRHHLDPERTKVSTSLGSSGPSPTRSDDADPSYVPPRVLGFTVADIDTGPLQRAARSMALDVRAPDPRLWQDEGDQA